MGYRMGDTGPRGARQFYRLPPVTVDATASSPVTILTVTGIVGVGWDIVQVGDSFTTSDAITASIGTATSTAKIIAQVADATDLTAGLSWVDATPDSKVEATAGIKVISEDVILTTTGTVTQGTLICYPVWYPVSAGATVVAA